LLGLVAQERVRKEQARLPRFSEYNHQERAPAGEFTTTPYIPFTGGFVALYPELTSSECKDVEIYSDSSINMDDGGLNCKTEFGELVGMEEHFLV